MCNHVFEKTFALRFSFERRVVGGRRRVKISRRVRRRPGGSGGAGLVGFAVGEGGEKRGKEYSRMLWRGGLRGIGRTGDEYIVLMP